MPKILCLPRSGRRRRDRLVILPEVFTIVEAVPDYYSKVSSAMNDMMMPSCSLTDEGQMSGEDEYLIL
jgi:hypothetical protein